MLSRSILNLLFLLGIIVLISVGVVNYIHLKNTETNNNKITKSFTIIKLVQHLGQILLHDHLHNANGSAKNEIEKTLDTLASLIDSASQIELKVLAYERINYFENETHPRKNNLQRFQKLAEEKNKINVNKLRITLNEIRSKEQDKINFIKDKSAEAGIFTSYTLIAGFVISILIFISFFIIHRNPKKWFDQKDEDTISYEGLEKIIRERTEEISAINTKLNKKIDEIKKIDETLKRSEKYYRTLFEHAHDAIMIISPENGRILEVNDRACEIYGFTKIEFQTISLDLISKNPPECKAKINEILSKGFIRNFQCVHYTKDMKEILIEINASVIEYNNSQGILAVNRDITERVLRININ